MRRSTASQASIKDLLITPFRGGGQSWLRYSTWPTATIQPSGATVCHIEPRTGRTGKQTAIFLFLFPEKLPNAARASTASHTTAVATMSGPDPLSISLASLKTLYLVINFTIDLNHCPNEVRRCLELVRTLYGDLQHLITLRNECLPVLSARPTILARTDLVITNAHDGLTEVCGIVEKLRPDRGKTSLQKRFTWIFLDSKEFKSQEPLVSRQHASVLAELNFLRMMVLSIGQPVWATENAGEKTKAVAPRVTAFNNISLLDDMMAGGRRVSSVSAPSPVVTVKQENSPDLGYSPGSWAGSPSSPLGLGSDRASLQPRRSTVFSTEGMSLLFGEASPGTPSDEQSSSEQRRPEQTSPSSRPIPAPEQPSCSRGAAWSAEPSPNYQCPPPYRGRQMSPQAQPVSELPIPELPVSISDPGDRVVCEAGYAAHYGLRHPLPPVSLRHRAAYSRNSILPWVPSVFEPSDAAEDPIPIRSPRASYHDNTPAPASPPRYPGQQPAFVESYRWNGARGTPAAFDSTGHVWVQDDSQRLSTIPPELIYSPPQVLLPRPSMPVEHCPYPATPPR
ncbi:hypothetical protein B0T11DRAFT_145259 [Plectosphaerella cucumerina]|uniref:Uncharacterized protein n=1 Tax=Plectosphaerella cucumerina TaxID=40658 RepID=A0A8K0T706_9PEZI|nr:hypothetical protein B0T11DRAFT_145259 [Plectosphaerella cucumerina]